MIDRARVEVARALLFGGLVWRIRGKAIAQMESFSVSPSADKSAPNRSVPLHERVAASLDSAGDATGAELLSLLRGRHSGDLELMDELEELLTGDGSKVPVLDGPITIGPGASGTMLRSVIVRIAQAEVASEGPTLPLGEGPLEVMPVMIGSYVVVRELGRGGMGVVYECEQAEPRRRVAVKVLRSGMGWGGSSGTSRLDSRREAQVLARLAHPGITRVIEAGVDAASGRTFFAMDLVGGTNLLRHAGEANLSIRERVELLARVCDAVEHAHRKGIIHRDIKPSNILVEPASDRDGTSRDEFARVGQPRVMDFGVAKLTRAEGEAAQEQSLLMPGSSAIVGTLGYISPEALSGDSHNVDTRADVYALGVVLYELLTGQAPISLQGVALSEVARRVCEASVPMLRAHDPRLRGDLEIVVLKAMAKAPELRYGSAGELGDDLRRFLRKEPIVAQPASAAYLARKFVSRHRVVSALGLGLVVALVAGLLTTLVMISRVERARTQERSQREIANAIRGYLVQDLIGAASPSAMGKDAKIVDVLGKLASEVDTRFQGQPELEGRVRHELATVFNGLGMYEESLQQSKAALTLLESSLLKDNAACIASLFTQATTFQNKGDAVSAELIARDGLARAERTLPPDDAFRARLESLLGASLHAQGKTDESISILSSLLARVESVRGLEFDDRCAFRVQYAAALQQAKPPRREEAIEQYLGVIALCEEANWPEHPASIAARNNMVSLLIALKRYEDAYEAIKPLLGLIERSMPREHPAHGFAALTMSRVQANLGHTQEAFDWAVRAVEALTYAMGDSTWQTERACSNAATTARALGDPAQIETWSIRTVASRLRNASRAELSTTVKVFEENASPRWATPEELLDSVLAQRDELVPVEHAKRGRFLVNLAWACARLQRSVASRSALDEAQRVTLEQEELLIRDDVANELAGIRDTGGVGK